MSCHDLSWLASGRRSEKQSPKCLYLSLFGRFGLRVVNIIPLTQDKQLGPNVVNQGKNTLICTKLIFLWLATLPLFAITTSCVGESSVLWGRFLRLWTSLALQHLQWVRRSKSPKHPRIPCPWPPPHSLALQCHCFDWGRTLVMWPAALFLGAEWNLGHNISPSFFLLAPPIAAGLQKEAPSPSW